MTNTDKVFCVLCLILVLGLIAYGINTISNNNTKKVESIGKTVIATSQNLKGLGEHISSKNREIYRRLENIENQSKIEIGNLVKVITEILDRVTISDIRVFAIQNTIELLSKKIEILEKKVSEIQVSIDIDIKKSFEEKDKKLEDLREELIKMIQIDNVEVLELKQKIISLEKEIENLKKKECSVIIKKIYIPYKKILCGRH